MGSSCEIVRERENIMSALGWLWLNGDSSYGASVDGDTMSTLSRSSGSGDIKKLFLLM